MAAAPSAAPSSLSLFPPAGPCTVGPSPTGGRGLFASRALRRGEVVLRVDSLAAVALGDGAKRPCWHCFGIPPRPLKRCRACGAAAYCGRECQAADWALHRSECARIRAFAPKRVPDLVRLVARAWDSLHGKSTGVASHPVFSLEGEPLDHAGDVRGATERSEGLVATAAVAKQFVGVTDDDADARALLQLVRIASRNSFSVCDDELNGIGTAMYLAGAMLNHSCSPNCVPTFEGRTLIVRGARTIATGEELTVSYVDRWEPREVRRRDLFDRYGFWCACAWCSDTSLSAVDAIGARWKCGRCPRGTFFVGDDATPTPCDACGTVETGDYVSDALAGTPCPPRETGDALKRAERLGRTAEEQLRILSPSNRRLLAVLNSAMDACIAAGLFDQAANWGERTLVVYAAAGALEARENATADPAVGLQLLRLAKLHVHNNRFGDALERAKLALWHLEGAYGSGHRLAAEAGEQTSAAAAELSAMSANGD